MEKIFVFFIILTLIKVIHGYTMMPEYIDENLALCIVENDDGSINEMPYHPTYELCCGQGLSQRTTYSKCCNGQYHYFSNRKICCNGQVVDKRVSKSTNKWEEYCESDNNLNCTENMCCGKQIILKKDDTFCCDGQQLKLTEDEVKIRDYLACCGKNEVYNKLTRMCCGGTSFPHDKNLRCCNNNIYNRQNKKCERNELKLITVGTCGKDDYNRLNHTCCEGQLVKNIPELIKMKRNPDSYCCGSSVINRYEKCCEKHLYHFPTHSIPKQPDTECCGLGHYNFKRQWCLNGKAVDRSPNYTKCGNELIDTRKEACCANKIPYNSDTHDCCEGSFYCVIKKGEKCCNGLKVEKNEVCCENIKPCKKRFSEDDDCCFDFQRNNGQTFKKKAESCYRGRIVPTPEGSLPCGLNDYYHPKYYFCCGEKKYKHGNGQCCKGVYSDISYNEGRCCVIDNKVYRFGDEENPCILKCNEKESYDISTELCCGERIYNYTGFNYCCGAFSIDPYVKGCCGQFPYPLSSRKSCCRNTQVYNTKFTTCTENGKLESKGVLRGRSDVQKLCSWRSISLFDGGVQQACQRKYAISGKVTSVTTAVSDQKDEFLLKVSLKNVKTLTNLTDTEIPTRVTFNIHIPGTGYNCKIDHFKRLYKVIVLFDETIVKRKVDIPKTSSFFLTPKTFGRKFAVTKAISKDLCKIFLTTQ